MKTPLILVLLILFVNFLFAQTTDAEKDLKKQNIDTITGWKAGGLISLTTTQVSLNKWAAGGQNSIAGNGFVNLFANLKQKNFAWDNNLDLGFGLIRQGDKDAPWVKSDDKIDFTSKYGQRASKKWFYAGLINFKSQFASGYANPEDTVAISMFMAPGYLLGALGMDFKPNDNFSFFISPITSKSTFVMNQRLADAGAFGVEAATYNETTGELLTRGKKFRTEFGGYLKAMFKKEIQKNLTFSTRLELFSNYLDNPQNVDVLWENIITLKLNKYISANLTTTLLYDDDVDIQWTDKNNVEHNGPTTQFKEVLGIGFSYKF